MSSSVNAILDGFDYQALWFWFYVVDMLSHEAEVDQVGFEVDEYAAFDDVAIRYRKPVIDGAGGTVAGKFYSIKLSVSYAKEIDAGVLDDPGLINASSRSLLQRLRDAVDKMRRNGQEHVFVLAAPWGLKSGDPIRELVNTSNGSVRVDRLFDGTGPKGQMGALRKRWANHLGLKDQDDLRPILSRLRFDLRSQTQEAHVEQLSLLLMGVKIRRILKNDMAAKHFRIPFALRKQGKRWHSRKDIVAVCQSQDLLLNEAVRPKRNAVQLGIRSFLPLAEGLGEKVDHLLCLTNEFAGRTPKSATVWPEVIPERLQAFLSAIVRPEQPYDLHLHCFGSIAFLTGYLLEPGLGVSPAIVQRQYGRPAEIWSVDAEAARQAHEPWSIAEQISGDGAELAIAINLTHVTTAKVIDHCRAALPDVGRILLATPSVGASHGSVRSGTDAYVLASTLKNRVTAVPKRAGMLHLFWAAPNAFAFYFGQVARMLGPCAIYEFDPDTQSYSQAILAKPAMRLTIKETQ